MLQCSAHGEREKFGYTQFGMEARESSSKRAIDLLASKRSSMPRSYRRWVRSSAAIEMRFLKEATPRHCRSPLWVRRFEGGALDR